MYIYILLYHYCITCNNTPNVYLFFYYKMQVIFKDFRQYFSSIRGDMFTLKKLIKCLAMPIVVLLHSQPKNSNSIQPNFTKIHSKIFATTIRTKPNKSPIKTKITYRQKYLLKAHKSSNLINPTLRNPNKILNKLRLSLKYIK